MEFIKYEFVNKKKAKWLIENIEKIEKRPSTDPHKLEACLFYCERVLNSKNGLVKVVYKKSNGSQDGRWFVCGKNNYGLQSIAREFRHTLCKDEYYDLDVKNCQPTILHQ